MAGPPQLPNEFLCHSDVDTEVSHPVRLYSRNMEKFHIFLRLTAEQTRYTHFSLPKYKRVDC